MMKINFGFLRAFALLSLMTVSLTSCFFNDEKDPATRIVEITINDPLVVIQPTITEGNHTEFVFHVLAETTQEQLKQFAPQISISSGCMLTPASGTPQDFTQPVTYVVKHMGTGLNQSFTVKAIRQQFTGAEIKSAQVSGAEGVVTEQPKINFATNEITFYVHGLASEEQILSIIPSFELAGGATISPEPGVAPGFKENTPITFTVTSEDKETKTDYTMVCVTKKIIYDLEQWKSMATGKAQRFEPGNLDDLDAIDNHWSTSNYGMATLLVLGKADKFTVFPAEQPDSYKNKGAKLITVKTKGGAMMGNKIPIITAGSLFLGVFKLNSSDNLKSTFFGVPFEKKPLRVRGYYKYMPGETFLRSSVAERHKVATPEPGTIDKWVATAVLFEVQADDEYLYGDNLTTATNIVAFGVVNGGKLSNYDKFTIDLDYKVPYNPAKKYKFSIVFSSSIDGDTFSGAEGSVLFVDEVEILYE